MPAHNDSNEPKLPTEIDGYRIQRVLGTGGMATVYAALQTQPRRTVALKIIKRGLDSKSALHRFKREVEILGKLRHPNIAQVYHAGTYDDGSGGAPYFVMEYIPGAKTIHEFAEGHELTLRDRLKLFVRTCAAVDHGHKNKVIHRDLKPSNMLVDESGVAKVIDFGIARSIDASGDDRTVHTEAGDLVGTIHYMAPEQLRNELVDLDARCDVYALGAVLYKLLTGKPPYQLAGLPLPTAALVVMEDEPVPPSLYRPELKGDLETILLKALEKDRARRYRSAGSLGRDIVRFLNNQPIQARPTTMWHKARLFMRRHRTAAIATAVASIAILAGGAAIITSIQRSARIKQDTAEQLRLEREALQATRDRLTDSTNNNVVPDVDRTPVALGGHRGAVTSVTFDPAGARVASGGDDERMSVWELATQRSTVAVHEHDAPIRAITLAGDATMTSIASDGTITRLDTARQRILGRESLDVVVVDAAMSPDGETVLVAADDLTVRLWQRSTGNQRTLRGTRGAFERVCVAGDGSLVAASSVGGSVYVWNTEGQSVRRFDDMPGRVIAIGFTSDLAYVVAIMDDGEGTLQPLNSDVVVGIPFDASREPALAAAIDPTGAFVVTSSATTTTVVNLADRSIVDDQIPASSDIGRVAVSSDGHSVVLGYTTGEVVVHPVARGAAVPPNSAP